MRRIWPLLLLAAAAGCGGKAGGPVPVTGGDPVRGERLIEHYGCGGCHTIPGIDRADARVGPSLADTHDKRFIAGRLPNTPEELARWIRKPQEVSPGTLMPDLGVKPDEARDIVAYLYRRT
jgi:cytochrome c2